MLPFLNRYPRRYHPYSRPLALHSSFPVEMHACPPHSLHTIFPTDPDVTAVGCPEPLAHKPIVTTAADYFAVLELQKPNTSYPKNDGEPGRRQSHKGYVLADVLAWPTEVYKEVQVIKTFSVFKLVPMIWDSQPSINSLKICLLLLSPNKRQMILKHFTIKYSTVL